MNDPVADILRERSRMESGAAAAVALSIAAHAGMTALAIWGAMNQTATHLPTVMNIRFAQVKPAVVAAAAPVEQPQKAPAAPAPVVKAEAPPAKPVVSAPKATGKPVEASPFGKSNKKENAPAPAAPATGVFTPAVASTQPEVAIEGGDFPYTVYIDRMKTLIGSHWFRPSNGTTTVQFTIDRDGGIRDVKTETASGNGTFDRAALRAVLESSPLPPLPFGYSGTYLVVHLTFR